MLFNTVPQPTAPRCAYSTLRRFPQRLFFATNSSHSAFSIGISASTSPIKHSLSLNDPTASQAGEDIPPERRNRRILAVPAPFNHLTEHLIPSNIRKFTSNHLLHHLRWIHVPGLVAGADGVDARRERVLLCQGPRRRRLVAAVHPAEEGRRREGFVAGLDGRVEVGDAEVAVVVVVVVVG